MSDTPFKTPLPYHTPRADILAPMNLFSDTDESQSDTGSSQDMSIVAEYDDLVRIYRKLLAENYSTQTSFISFVTQAKQIHGDYFTAVNECRRLQTVVDLKTHEIADLEAKLGKARKLLDNEKIATRTMRKERDDFAAQIAKVNEMLCKTKNNEIRAFLSKHSAQNEWEQPPQMSAIKEINSTGSILSDFSYSRSEDDLDASLLHAGKAWKKHRPSTEGLAEPAVKKRKSSGHKVVEIAGNDTVRATTTLTVSKNGPITATSVIESVPKTPTVLPHHGTPSSKEESCPSAPPSHLVFESWARESPRKPARNLNGRQHVFQQKTVVMPETCSFCEKRIGFGRTANKCKDCKAVCHVECKDNLPMPCIPTLNTPNQRNNLGLIGDYTPTTPPMVPAILIHCINEIELRGFTEVGIYRIPGAERDVKHLKEKFLKGRGAPILSQLDIHVICGTVKDFLRSLREPLITHALWKDFVAAVEARNEMDVAPALFQALSELPQPNRDTLAYMILHLKRVAEVRECKMGVSNLAKVFGPTIVGYSSENPDPNILLQEMVQSNNVMESLINIPTDYWSSFINLENVSQPSKLQQTPSTDSLLRPALQKSFFTPNRNMAKRKQKYFYSPKN